MHTMQLRRWHVLLICFVIVLFSGIFIGVGKSHKSNLNIVTKPVNASAAQGISLLNNSSQEKQTGSDMQPASVQTSNHTQKIYYQNKVAVLTYHHIDPAESTITISPERFKAHLETLKNNGFHVISVEDLIDFLQKKKSVPPNAVVITFDDGYESVYKYAYPILKSEGMTATTFLIISYVEDGTVHQPPILNWQEILDMHKDGYSFYSHTYNSHQSVIKKGKEYSELITKLLNPSTNQLETDSEYKTRIHDDFIKADEILNAKLGNQLNLLCLPHGQYNQAVIDIANQAQIPFLFTGVEGFNTNANKTALIKRINAGSPYMSDKLLVRKLSQGKFAK